MTLSLHRLGAGAQAGTYYTADSGREARPDRRDDYYLSEGGGVWWSSGQSVVRHDAAIDAQSFRDLCAGIDPGTGKALVRGAGEGHWAGLDMTMTPGKSVSVLWMAGDAARRAIIEAAHRKAVAQALEFVVAENLIVVRSGAAGIVRHAPSDLIVARFDHYTTREGDPNIHTHCVLMNVAGAPPGAGAGRYAARHLTIEPARVFDWQRVVGATYRASLAHELRQAFGFEYREAGQGQWEVAGIPDGVLAQFSKRSQQIEARVGPDASSAQREIAALATRQGKDLVPTGDELEARWRAELAALASDPWADASSPDRAAINREEHVRDHSFVPPEISGDSAVARAASILFRHESVIERKSLLQRALELGALDGKGIEAVEAELGQLERDRVLVALAGDERTSCWTTPAIAACEASMLRAANRFEERDWITIGAVETTLARASHLSLEQQLAVRHAAGRDGVAILEAGAGTGKTTMARALVDAAHQAGLTVVGLAPSWVAADELAASTGIPAQAIARWRYNYAQGLAAHLDTGTLVLIDESGMVGTRDMEAVLSAAQSAGAKVVLLGDRRQLASVSGASALRAIADVVERSAVLTDVRRQQVDWQRAASVLMARGDATAGLRAYATHDRVELVSGERVAQERVIQLWQEQRAVHSDDVLMITRRNADAMALNRSARETLRAEGRLGPDLVEVRALDRSDKLTTLALAIGDRLRFGETLPHLGLRNGSHAQVVAIRPGSGGATRMGLKLNDGRQFEVDWSELAREPRFGRKATPPRIVHAYAGTAFAAQGRTAAATVLYVASDTDAREIYVGLSRHRRDARVVVERDRLDALCRQRQADSRIPATKAAVLEQLYSEARQYREKVNVVDHVPDRQTFVRDGVILGPPQLKRLDIQSAVRAASGVHRLLSAVDHAPRHVAVRQLVSRTPRELGPDRSVRHTRLVRSLMTLLGRSADRGDINRSVEHER